MFGSAVVYAGFVGSALGLILTVRPIPRFGVGTRSRGLAVAGGGVLVAGVGLVLPVFESQAASPATSLDEFAPLWQFREFHSIRVAAPRERVFDAIRQVRADEVFLFHTLTWIRRGGRPLAPGILNPGIGEPLLDAAVRGGFLRLAEDEPRELVVGAVIIAPPGQRARVTAQTFGSALPPGFALATMNFLVVEDGPGCSRVSTETRVYANSASARRRFAAYWRVIYPGSALIRVMWLRAIERRATKDPKG